MEGFSLLSLNSTNLDKVIGKVQKKSFIRLQQTCRDVADFIHSSPNISVSVDGSYELEWNRRKRTWSVRCGESSPFKIEALYGARLEDLIIVEGNNPIALKNLCSSLKKSRITCKCLYSYAEWSTEDCRSLLNILTPSKVVFGGASSQPEAVFNVKSLKSVHVRQFSGEVAAVLEKLLSTLEEVAVIVIEPVSNPFVLLSPVVQILLSKSRPNLRLFNLTLVSQNTLPLNEMKTKISQELGIQRGNIKVMTYIEEKRSAQKDDLEEERIKVTVNLPPEFPNSSSCNMTIKDRKVYYIKYQLS